MTPPPPITNSKKWHQTIPLCTYSILSIFFFGKFTVLNFWGCKAWINPQNLTLLKISKPKSSALNIFQKYFRNELHAPMFPYMILDTPYVEKNQFIWFLWGSQGVPKICLKIFLIKGKRNLIIFLCPVLVEHMFWQPIYSFVSLTMDLMRSWNGIENNIFANPIN